MPLLRSAHEKEDMEHVKSTVIHSNYFFGNPLDVNDPFDCEPIFRSVHHKDKTNQDQQEQLRSVLDHSGIFCVADELYDTLMWSHYANSHRSVALQFCAKQIKKTLPKEGIIDRVYYSQYLPVLTLPKR